MSRIKRLQLKKNNVTNEYDVGEEQQTSTKNIGSQSIGFAVVDEEDNVILAVDDGHVRTKNFDSRTASSSGNSNSFLMEGGNIDSSGFDLIPSCSFDGNGDPTISYETFSSMFNGYSRSAFYVNVHNAESLIVEGINNFVCYAYDSAQQFISSVSTTNGSVTLPANTIYVRIAVATGGIEFVKIYASGNNAPLTEEKRMQVRSGDDITSGGQVIAVVEERLVFSCDGEMFTPALMIMPPNYTPNGKKVPLVVWDSGDGSYKNWQSYHMGTSYANRVKGMKYLRDQGFAVLEIYPWGSYNYYHHYNCGGRAAMPLPTHIKTHDKGVAYVCSRYNIDADNVFEISKSGSGKLSLYYAIIKPKFNLKGIYAFAPVFDDFAVGTGSIDFRNAINEDLNLEDYPGQVYRDDNTQPTPLEQYLNGTPLELGGSGSQFHYLPYDLTSTGTIQLQNIEDNQAFIKHNAGKFALVAVSWTNLMGQTSDEKAEDSFDWANTVQAIIYDSEMSSNQKSAAMKALTFNDCYGRIDLSMVGNDVPIKVIMGQGDEQTPYLSCAEVVKQLSNGGKEATLVTLQGGHSAPDMGSNNNVVTNVTTINGVTYDSVAIGWYIACEDIMKRYLAHIDSEVYDYLHP